MLTPSGYGVETKNKLSAAEAMVGIVNRLLSSEATVNELSRSVKIDRKRIGKYIRLLRAGGCVYRSGYKNHSPVYAIQPSPFLFPDATGAKKSGVKTSHQPRVLLSWRGQQFTKQALATLFGMNYLALWRCLAKGIAIDRIFKSLPTETQTRINATLPS
jgi:hypothetical protein